MIGTQPSPGTVCSGDTAIFSVAASGGSLTYQWRQNGTNLVNGGSISGSTTPTLTLSGVTAVPGRCIAVSAGAYNGTAWGAVVADRTYWYQASGCVAFNKDGNAFSDPDGNVSSMPGCSNSAGRGVAAGLFTCPGLYKCSLVGTVGGACIQLGSRGSFVAPASGTLLLYCNDDIFTDNSGSWNVCLGTNVDSQTGFDVVVTDTCGSGTSVVATLTVYTAPACVTLAVTSPSDNSYTTNSTITMNGTAASAFGLAGVSVGGFAATSSDLFTNWQANIAGLAVGTNALAAVATDDAAPAHALTNVVRVIYASGTFDGNGDGLPDAWQLKYFGSVSAPGNGPNDDPDGDGISNLQEFLAGSDPTNPASYFHVTSVARTGNDVRVIWMTGSGRTNALEWTAGGPDGSYTTNGFVGLFVVTNTVGGTTNYLDIGGATNVPSRFYRLRLVP